MLADIMDMITFPVVQFLLMLKDENISSYLGVSVLGIAVTCMIVLIVFKALVSTVNSNIASLPTTIARVKKDRSERSEKDV
jgi:hypothetical protein